LGGMGHQTNYKGGRERKGYRCWKKRGGGGTRDCVTTTVGGGWGSLHLVERVTEGAGLEKGGWGSNRTPRTAFKSTKRGKKGKATRIFADKVGERSKSLGQSCEYIVWLAERNGGKGAQVFDKKEGAKKGDPLYWNRSEGRERKKVKVTLGQPKGRGGRDEKKKGAVY